MLTVRRKFTGWPPVVRTLDRHSTSRHPILRGAHGTVRTGRIAGKVSWKCHRTVVRFSPSPVNTQPLPTTRNDSDPLAQELVNLHKRTHKHLIEFSPLFLTTILDTGCVLEPFFRTRLRMDLLLFLYPTERGQSTGEHFYPPAHVHTTRRHTHTLTRVRTRMLSQQDINFPPLAYRTLSFFGSPKNFPFCTIFHPPPAVSPTDTGRPGAREDDLSKFVVYFSGPSASSGSAASALNLGKV